MKKAILMIGAVTVMLAGFASQSFAGVSIHLGFFAPAPVYVAPAPPVYERVHPVVVEGPAYYRSPVGYNRVVREGWHRDCDRWDRDRWDRGDWRRDRAERHWR